MLSFLRAAYVLRDVRSHQFDCGQNPLFYQKVLLIGTVVIGDNSPMSIPTGWTKSDVIALMALVVGLPAAMVAVIVIPAVWKRHCWRRRGESSTFAVSVSFCQRLCGL